VASAAAEGVCRCCLHSCVDAMYSACQCLFSRSCSARLLGMAASRPRVRAQASRRNEETERQKQRQPDERPQARSRLCREKGVRERRRETVRSRVRVRGSGAETGKEELQKGRTSLKVASLSQAPHLPICPWPRGVRLGSVQARSDADAFGLSFVTRDPGRSQFRDSRSRCFRSQVRLGSVLGFRTC
jgi:hypothetical protein